MEAEVADAVGSYGKSREPIGRSCDTAGGTRKTTGDIRRTAEETHYAAAIESDIPAIFKRDSRIPSPLPKGNFKRKGRGRGREHRVWDMGYERLE